VGEVELAGLHVGAHHQHRGALRPSAPRQLGEQLEPVHPGHGQVEQHHAAAREAVELAQSLLSVTGLDHPVALEGEDLGDTLPDARVVVDDQDHA
jgi:hypothetical protein